MSRKLKNPRALAAKVLADVVAHGQSLDSALARLDQHAAAGVDDRAKALVRELAYGCMRWYHYLDAIADRLLEKRPKKKDTDIVMLVLVGLYQLHYLSTSDHAAVNETVAATTELGKPWAKGLVNGCLRNFQRQHVELLSAVKAQDPDIEFSHPQWLLDEIRECWPGHWQQILVANNQRPPMHLRVNLAGIGRNAALEKLGAEGIDATPLATECGIALVQPQPVERLPGFADGELSVQDQSAQYSALLLDPKPGEHLLDACAAPGGKACHLLEHTNGQAQLVAVEIDAGRAQRIHENMQRLGLDAEIKVADALDTDAWWSGQPFDRILIDAPCSATGVIRRHPDIKFLRRASDIEQLVDIQSRLLEALWPLLRQGGKLLYATCSILKRENEQQINTFLGRHADAKTLPLALRGDAACRYGVQLLPGTGDGFFYCLLEKN